MITIEATIAKQMSKMKDQYVHCLSRHQFYQVTPGVHFYPS